MFFVQSLIFFVVVISVSIAVAGYGSLIKLDIKKDFFLNIFLGFIVISFIITFIHFFLK